MRGRRGEGRAAESGGNRAAQHLASSLPSVAPRDPDLRRKLAAAEKEVARLRFEEAIAAPDEDAICVADRVDLDTMPVDAAYAGPRMADDPARPGRSFITADFVEGMIAAFKAQQTIHRRYAFEIVLQARDLLRSLPPLVDVPVPQGTGITVCGDVHGQFYDLLHIFELNGMPSGGNPYLFNGDFVDRGSFSVEVILTLFALKVRKEEGGGGRVEGRETARACAPTPTPLPSLLLSVPAPALAPPRARQPRVQVHEQGVRLRRRGVWRREEEREGPRGRVRHPPPTPPPLHPQVRAKYTPLLADLFRETFCALPLAHVLGAKVFVVHGGLFSRDGVTLADLRAVDRFREPPEEGLMCEALWSDPGPEPGRQPSKRGVGVQFGADVTRAFLEANGLSLLVRSHEVKDEGYEIAHDGYAVTVFSAPRYLDQMDNKGAFIKFDDALTPAFTVFDASPHPPVRPMAYSSMFMGGLLGM